MDWIYVSNTSVDDNDKPEPAKREAAAAELHYYYYYVYTSNTTFKVHGLDELLYCLGEPGVHCVRKKVEKNNNTGAHLIFPPQPARLTKGEGDTLPRILQW
jgi:hypothetical protein